MTDLATLTEHLKQIEPFLTLVAAVLSTATVGLVVRLFLFARTAQQDRVAAIEAQKGILSERIEAQKEQIARYQSNLAELNKKLAAGSTPVEEKIPALERSGEPEARSQDAGTTTDQISKELAKALGEQLAIISEYRAALLVAQRLIIGHEYVGLVKSLVVRSLTDRLLGKSSGSQELGAAVIRLGDLEKKLDGSHVVFEELIEAPLGAPVSFELSVADEYFPANAQSELAQLAQVLVESVESPKASNRDA